MPTYGLRFENHNLDAVEEVRGWMEAGLVIYAGFGWRKSRLANPRETPARATVHRPIMAVALVAFVGTVIYAIMVFGKGQ